MAIKSWDFWDTLFTRSIEKPSDAFLIIEYSLNIDDFSEKRISAEKSARAKFIEPTLEEIYHYLDIPKKKEVYNFEVSLDQLLLSPINENISNFKNKDLITSDYYLGADHLYNLSKEVIGLNKENINVSCDYSASKSSGALYKKLKKKNLNITDHEGDNYVSDVKKARTEEINASFYESSNIQTKQELFFKNLIQDPLSSSLLSGAFRAARLAKPIDISSSLWNFSVQTLAPCVLYICKELRNYCLSSGVNHIVFLSRDGYILYKAMGILFPDEFKYTYLNFSRKAIKCSDNKIKSYLENNGIISEGVLQNNICIFDVGWRGGAYKKLKHVLEKKCKLNGNSFHGFYLYVDNDDKDPALFGLLNYDTKLPERANVIEACFSAPFRSTEKFIDSYPYFKYSEINNPNIQFTTNIVSGIETFFKIFKNNNNIKSLIDKVDTRFLDPFLRFISSPTKGESELFKDFLWEEEDNKKPTPIVLGIRNCLEGQIIYWREGTYKQMNLLSLYKAYRFFKKIMKMTIEGYKNFIRDIKAIFKTFLDSTIEHKQNNDHENNQLKKKERRTAFYLIFERGLRLTSALFIGIYIAKELGEAFYGQLSLYLTIQAFLFSIIFVGLDGSGVNQIMKFNKTNASQGKIISHIYLIIQLSSIFISFLFLLTAALSGQFLELWPLSICFLLLPLHTYYLLLQVKNKFIHMAFASIAIIVLVNTLRLVLLYYFDNYIQFYFIFLTYIFELSLYSITYFFLSKYNKIELKLFKFKIDKSLVYLLLKKSFPVYISSFLMMLFTKVDQFVVLTFFDYEMVGNLVLGNRLVDSLNAIISVMISMWAVKIYSLYYDQSAELAAFLRKITSYILFFALSVFTFFYFFAETIINFIFVDKYEFSASIVPYQMISLLFISLGYLFNVLALCLNLEKWLALKAILAITIYLISAVVLIPIYGIMGSVIATIVANLSFVILINLVVPSQRKILNLYIKR